MSWLSPIALKELLVPRPAGEDVTPAALASVGLAALLGAAWVLPHPLMLQVRHAPLALACGLTLVQLLASIHRARAVLDERAAGTYETLILAGASGARFVSGMVQASVLRGLQPLALALPVFAAGAAALGTPLGTLASFYLVLMAQLVLSASLGVLAASEPPSTTGRRASGVSAGFAIAASGYVLPVLSAFLMLPTVLIAVRGISPGPLAALGDAAWLPLAFCAPAVFAIRTLHIGGLAIPFLPFAIAANLAAAAIPFAHAAARHRLHRHDATQVRRALTAAATVGVLALVAASVPHVPLVLIAVVHLALMLMIAPDATAPAWPATGPDDRPGRGRWRDLFRERCGTGLAFVGALSVAAAPFYALAVPVSAPARVAACAWIYVTVVALTWALLSWELPTPEPVARSGLGLRAAVLLLAAISLATVMWDETLFDKQPPLLVLPVRLVLGAAVLSTPLSGLLGLTALLVGLPVLRRGNLAGAALLCHTTPENLLLLSLGWHALIAILAWLRTRIRLPRDYAEPRSAP